MPGIEVLKQMAQVLEKNKVKNIQIIGNPKNSKNKLDQFYDHLNAGNFENEQNAAEFFYGKDASYPAYRQLKSRLLDRMINSVFFIDVNQANFNEIHQAYYHCYKNSAAVKILLGRNARLPAVKLAEKTLRKAIHFEFTDIVLALSKELRIHYSNIIGSKKKFQEYNDIVHKNSEILMAELKAEEYYSELIVHFVNSSETKPELIDKTKQYSDNLIDITAVLSSYRLNLMAHMIHTLRYEIESDWAGTAQACLDALNYFEVKKHLASNTVRFIFLFKLLSCFIQLKKYVEGEETAKKAIKLTPAGNGNWFKAMDQYIILLFHSKKFQKAYDIYRETVQHPKFKNQYKNIAEHLKIHEAFIYYLILKGEIKPEKKDASKKFRISKFLNDVPTYSKDKRGTNTSILILQILFLLQQEKYSKIIDRMEPLKTYAHRYLRKDETYRSNCFIKMLLQVPQAQFHKEAVKRKADKYLKKLHEVPISSAKQSTQIEIIPYETLWEYVLDSLDNRFH